MPDATNLKLYLSLTKLAKHYTITLKAPDLFSLRQKAPLEFIL